MNSDELDEEYKMLEDRFDHIDNISFYFYIKRRVNAAVNKTTVFKHSRFDTSDVVIVCMGMKNRFNSMPTYPSVPNKRVVPIVGVGGFHRMY